MQETGPKLELDLLHSVERLTREVDKSMEKSSRSVLKRYPLLFTLLVLFGVVAVSEGVRGIFEEVGIFHDDPFVLFVVGLIILIVTGSLFKKLDNKHPE